MSSIGQKALAFILPDSDRKLDTEAIISPFLVAKYKEDQRLPFALLSDFNKDVINDEL